MRSQDSRDENYYILCPSLPICPSRELRDTTDRFEIHEYSIMERFCLSVDDEDIRDDLCDAIRGRGAFRRFKDRIQAYGIAEDWYRYRDEALREIAMAWCEEHDIPYTET
jgi:hypothetical protein